MVCFKIIQTAKVISRRSYSHGNHKKPKNRKDPRNPRNDRKPRNFIHLVNPENLGISEILGQTKLLRLNLALNRVFGSLTRALALCLGVLDLGSVLRRDLALDQGSVIWRALDLEGSGPQLLKLIRSAYAKTFPKILRN